MVRVVWLRRELSRTVAVGVIAVAVAKRRRYGMLVRGIAIGVGVARVVGDIADGVVGIGVVVRPRAGDTKRCTRRIAGERAGQAVQPLILKTLFLTNIHWVIKVRLQRKRFRCDIIYFLCNSLFQLYYLASKYRFKGRILPPFLYHPDIRT